MFILSITPGQIATTVWQTPQRTITGGIGSSAIHIGSPNVVIAAASTVDLRPPAGFIRYATVFLESTINAATGWCVASSQGLIPWENLPVSTALSKFYVMTPELGVAVTNGSATDSTSCAYFGFDYN